MALQEVGVKLILEGAGGFMSELGNANAAVDKFAGQASSSAQSAAGGFSAFEGIVTGALHRVGEAAVNAGAQAAQAITGLVGSSISAAGEFEGGMLQFEAAAGSAMEAAGMSVKDFEDLFMNLGAKLPVSTAEVQAAALALAKAGLDPAIIAAGGLESSLNFASAAGMGLADAAELGTSMMATFTSITDDAATKTAFLASSQDLLVKAANSSKLNVDSLGAAMLAAGGQAKAVGLDYQDLVTTMGLIAPGFSSAAEAGTSFKNMLVRLQPSTQPAKDAFAELSLSSFNTQKAMQFLAEKGITPISPALIDVKDALLNYMEANQMTQAAQEKMWASFDTSVFFDAQGAFIGMEQASQKLKDAFVGLSDADRVRLMQQIFGNDAMGAANALVDAGAEGYRAFAEQMLSANGVMAQSAAVNQGFDFAMQNLSGTLEVVQLKLGSFLLPTMEALAVITNNVINALMGNADAYATLAPPLQMIVTGAQTLGTTLGIVGAALMDAGPFSLEFAESLSLIHPALQPMMLGLGQVISFLQNNWQAAITIAGGVLAAVMAPALVAGAAAFGAVLVAAAPVIAILAVVGLAAAALKSAWDQNLGGIQEKTAAAMTAVQSIISTVMGAVASFWDKNGADIQAFTQRAWSQVQSIVVGVVGIVSGVLSQLATFIDQHGATIEQIITGAWQVIQGIIGGALTLIEGLVTSTLQLIEGDFTGAWETIQKMSAEFVVRLGDVIMGLWAMFEPGLQLAWDNFVTWSESLGSDVVNGVVQGIEGAADQVIGALTKMAADGLAAAKAALGIQSPSKVFAAEVGMPIAEEGIAAGILEGMGDVGDALDQLGDEALKKFEGIANQMGKLMDESLSGRAGLLRGQSAGIDIIADLEARQKKIEAAAKKLPAYNPNMSDEQRAELNKIGSDRQVVANQLLYAQQELNKATEQAMEIGKLDARAGADYLAKRQSQIKELMKLQEAADAGTDDPATRQRAQLQLDLIKRAQEVELQQLQNSLAKRANELGGLGEGYTATGNAIVDGMIAGMQARSKEMADALKNVLMFALRGAQESLGIKSPSLVFAQQVGLPIAEGIAMGVANSAGIALGAVGDLANSLVRPAAPALARGGMGSSSVTNHFNYAPQYQGAPRQPSQDFASMRVLATSR